MIDPNNRPGGDSLILTAKSANKVQFFDAATLAQDRRNRHARLDPRDGALGRRRKVYASIYGGGIFGKNKDPDRRIAVIDLDDARRSNAPSMSARPSRRIR